MASLRPQAIDGFGRRFRYLRLSVTEVCNFRCDYCLPNGYRKTPGPGFLTVDEVRRLVRGFADLGLSKVRLTGGEPSVRKDFVDLIAAVAACEGVHKVAVTTNGWNLEQKVMDWRRAGLTHLNLSIDALERETFARITGHDRLDSIIRGLDRALEADFKAVKVNAVLLRETVEQGLVHWADFVRDKPVSVRFIELMRTADNADYFERHHVGGRVVRDWLTQRGWTPRQKQAEDGPATEYVHPDHQGAIGLIAPYEPGFCDGCNRLRVTSRGKLRLCLFGEGGVDLRPLLSDDADQLALMERINLSLGGKAQAHGLNQGNFGDTPNLAAFGG